MNSKSTIVTESFRAELIEAATQAYHDAPPRWDDEKKVSMHTGIEAAVDVTLSRVADRIGGIRITEMGHRP